jgi:hypothetical protein
MPRRGPIDFTLRFTVVPLVFLSGRKKKARAEGNTVCWNCKCGDPMPLSGRCYFQFGDNCHTICPSCGRKYRVIGRRPNPTAGKKAVGVKEIK